MTKPTIFVVDDNREVLDLIEESLHQEGYNVVMAETAAELVENLAQATAVDTILLDIVLPDDNGLNLIQKIREYTDAPVIIISGKGETVDKVVGLEMGADDYVAKPFRVRELAARVKANVRRYHAYKTGDKAVDSPKKPEKIPFGDWVLDPAKLQVFDAEGKSAQLTVPEFRLLTVMVMSPNRVLSREYLIEQSRNNESEVFDRAVDIQIARIRKKLGDDARTSKLIQTVRGGGYMLVLDNAKD